MRSRFIIFIVVTITSALISACSAPATDNGANATASANTANTNKPAGEVVLNNAPTLTPVFKAYCEASLKGDEAGLRKVYSSDTLKYWEAGMKEDKIKTLVEFLQDDKVASAYCEVVNEEINGDQAVGTIKSDKYPKGNRVKFVKENGEWKMTNIYPGSVTEKPANVAK